MLERHGAALRTYLAQLPGADRTAVEAVTQAVLREIQEQKDLEEDPLVWLFARGRQQLTGTGHRGDGMLAQTDEAAEADDPAEDGRVAVHRVFARLTSKQQEALRLKFQFGFNAEETARITGLSPAGASGLLHHAIERVVAATAAGRSKASSVIRDPRITAYALEEMGPDEKQAFVASVADGKALLTGTEAIRQAGRQLRQILESGEPLPKRRRRRKGGAGFRLGLTALVVVGLAALGWYFIARSRAPGRGEATEGTGPGSAGLQASAGKERAAGGGPVGAGGQGVVARTAPGRNLRPGEAEWERKAFGHGNGQAAGATGGASAALPGGGMGGAEAGGGGGLRSPGAPTGALGTDEAALAQGEYSDDETAPTNGRAEATLKADPAALAAEAMDEPADAGPVQAAKVARSAPPRTAARQPGETPAAPAEPGEGKEEAMRSQAKAAPGPGIGGMRKRLADKEWPKTEEIHLAEMVRQGPPEPPRPEVAAAEEPLTAQVEVAPSPWTPGRSIVRVSVRAKPVTPPARTPVNLVLAIDVSESMRGPNRLPLLQEGMRLLAERLRPDDRVAVVTYAGQAIEVLPSQPLGAQARELRGSLNGLTAAGRTNGYAGLELAYDVARRAQAVGGKSVVLLCTDGNFNLGETDERVLAARAAREAAGGVTLSVFGFGRSDRNDLRLELLAREGGGRSCYVNTREEAERLLAGQVDGLLEPTATEVGLQIDFKSEMVGQARSLTEGNAVEVAELLPGRQLVALYEVDFKGGAVPGAEAWAGLQVEYREAGTGRTRRLVRALAEEVREWSQADAGFKHAVAMAELGRILQDGAAGAGPGLDRLESWVRVELPDDAGGYRQELLELVAAAREAAARR
ncbi:von Willebrand factor type A domain protein [Lacunisphaera limnophila]|uniref:von Willebrand factor type A domain protein n=1 Tax=Lacunisphaera limnophila TaxID=1838286 RepID=A0A1D8AVB2_9BACT|nr:von Willebrand factor type A domain protein [Lacunisphaera limnophila]